MERVMATIVMECQMKMRPATPGEILRELYLAPAGVTVVAFAKAAGISRKHMSRIIHGHSAITADVAERIAEALGTTAHYWLNLQNAIDLYDARERLRAAEDRPQRMAAFAHELAAA